MQLHYYEEDDRGNTRRDIYLEVEPTDEEYALFLVKYYEVKTKEEKNLLYKLVVDRFIDTDEIESFDEFEYFMKDLRYAEMLDYEWELKHDEAGDYIY